MQAFIAGDTKALAAREPVRMFLYKTVSSAMIYGQGLRAFTIEEALVFLPRGVLSVLYAGKPKLGSWRAVGSGFEILLEGKSFSLQVSRGLHGAASTTLYGPSGNRTYWEVARPNDRRLAGRFETLYSGGSGSGGNVPVISSEGRKALVLTPDHRFVLSKDSSTTAVDKSSVTAVSNSNTLRGNWRYDPTAFTLTLEPDGGQPALAGPTFSSAAWSEGLATNSDWSILGIDSWWRADPASTPPPQ